MNFRNPYLFYIAFTLVFTVMVFLSLYARRRSIYLAHLGKLKDSKTFQNFQKKSKRVHKVRLILLVLILLLCAVLMGQPYTSTTTRRVSDSSDVMIVIDASSSAQSYFKSISVSLRELMEESSGNNFGVTIIAGKPRVLVAPTAHYETLYPIIDDLNIMNSQQFLDKWTDPSSQGSAIGNAMILATDSFGQINPRQKIILLFSDGKNNKGIGIEQVGNYLAIRNTIVISAFIVPNGQQPTANKSLQTISDMTNGSYITVDNQKAAAAAVNSVKKRVHSNSQGRVYREIPLAFMTSLIVLMAALILIDKGGQL